jgi:hypothetical protein
VGLDGGQLDLREVRELGDQLLAIELVVAGDREPLLVRRGRFRWARERRGASGCAGARGSSWLHRLSGQSHCLGHCLGAKAAVVIDPALGVKPRLGENRLSAGEEVFDPIGDPLVPARRAVIGRAVAGLEGPEADDFGELADRLEQGPTAGAQIADPLDRACRTVQAGLAG